MKRDNVRPKQTIYSTLGENNKNNKIKREEQYFDFLPQYVQ